MTRGPGRVRAHILSRSLGGSEEKRWKVVREVIGTVGIDREAQ
jgi:hypothetical protein